MKLVTFLLLMSVLIGTSTFAETCSEFGVFENAVPRTTLVRLLVDGSTHKEPRVRLTGVFGMTHDGGAGICLSDGPRLDNCLHVEFNYSAMGSSKHELKAVLVRWTNRPVWIQGVFEEHDVGGSVLPGALRDVRWISLIGPGDG